MHLRDLIFALMLLALLAVPQAIAAQDNVETLEKAFARQIETLTELITESPKQVSLYSRRGDAYFFTGQFEEAVADYSKMVELDPASDSSHWRRGIALFYIGKYDDAVAQFNRYHTVDNVDRENGIWRYLSQYKSKGEETARKELIKYEKDDREPFGDVYRLFADEMTGEEILKKIFTAKISPTEREKRLFYATLYIGLNYSVEGNRQQAKKYLKEAVENKWPATASYGPNYVWHVARLHYKLNQASEINSE